MILTGFKSASNEIGRRFGSDVYQVMSSIGRFAMDISQQSLEIGFTAYLDASAERCGGVLEDLTRSYCLLIKDGTEYSYIHRTLQEYFAANCLTKSEILNYYRYNMLVARTGRENHGYFKIIMEIGLEKFEHKFVLQALGEYVAKLKPLIVSSPKEFLSMHISSYGISDEGDVRYVSWAGGKSLTDLGWWNFAGEFLRTYDPVQFKDSYFSVQENLNEVKGLIERNDDDDMAEYEVNVFKLSNSGVKRLRGYKYFVERVRSAEGVMRKLERRLNSDKMKAAKIIHRKTKRQ